MNHQFDELTKSMAQSVTRRGALKKFGFGLAGMALGYFGLVNEARAAKSCSTDAECGIGNFCYDGKCAFNGCLNLGQTCERSSDCCSGKCARLRLPWSNSYYRGCVG